MPPKHVNPSRSNFGSIGPKAKAAAKKNSSSSKESLAAVAKLGPGALVHKILLNEILSWIATDQDEQEIGEDFDDDDEKMTNSRILLL